MSAFVCSPKHVAVLAQRLLQCFNGQTGREDATTTVAEFAAKLAILNLKSVAHRYRCTPSLACHDFLGISRAEYIRRCKTLADSQVVWAEEFSQARLWGLASCFLYQSCEHDGAEKDVTYDSVAEYERVLRAYCKREGVERDGWSL
jgi:hypothetical protein